MDDWKRRVVATARDCGFDLVAVTGAADFAGDRAAALQRIADGLMDGLPWYTESRVIRGTSPAELLPGAQSVISLGVSYWVEPPGRVGDADTPAGPAGRPAQADGLSEPAAHLPEPAAHQPEPAAHQPEPAAHQPEPGAHQPEPAAHPPGPAAGLTGRVARYAWARDYHRALKRRMRELVRRLESMADAPVAARWYVDDGPMLDRAAARRAGLGWFGKNGNILSPGWGSWTFLGQLITDLPLEPDAPLSKTCGACVRCIDACPTGAIVAPYVVDNARCISYLTIEHRGAIPRELRPLMGDWVFGCDLCQEVCPVNRQSRPSTQPVAPAPAVSGHLDLPELLSLSEAEFRAKFAGTSLRRAKWEGMLRNACVALGNRRDPAAVPVLRRTLLDAPPLARAHAAWALGRIATPAARESLNTAARTETDPAVQEEIRQALSEAAAG